MSVSKTTNSLARTATAQSTAATPLLPKPTAPKKGFFSGLKNKNVVPVASDPLAAPKEKKGLFSKLFKKDKNVAAAASNPPAAPEQGKAVEAPKVQAPIAEPREEPKAFDLSSLSIAQALLKDTTRSTFDKLKSLLDIPKSLDPVVNMFLGKGTKANVKVGIENNALTLTTDLHAPKAGIRGTAVLSLPVTAQPANDALTELHPVIIDKLSKALDPLLPEEEQVKAVVRLLSTLPSEVLKFTWSNGSADVIITLPSGASLKLNLAIPTSEESEKTPDILRTFLKSILKENYAGLETLLNKDMVFNWDGSTSRFEIRFPQQLALHIEEISSIDISNPILRELVTSIGKNSTLIIPQNIRGTIDFKNPSIEFDRGTTFIVKNAPNITIKRIAYDPSTEKMSLRLKVGVLPSKNIEIDMKESPKKPPKKGAVEKPNIIKYAFVPVTTEDTALPETQVAAAPKSTISVFESLKKMIKIPKDLEPLIGIFFADQTKLDVNIGIEDNLTVSVNNLNIPRLGVTGKASLMVPTKLTVEKQTVTLPREIMEIIEKLAGKTLQADSLEEFALITNLTELALTLPNQTIRMEWKGNIGKATLFITLPGGMELTLELDVKNIPAENDILRKELFNVLNSEVKLPKNESPVYFLHTRLLEALNKFGRNDFRYNQLRKVLIEHTDKNTIAKEFEKTLGRDFLRTKLAEVLGDQFSEIEPFLSQTMSFKWDRENNAVLELPNMGITGKASILFPKKPIAAPAKKAVVLHPKIKEALRELMTSGSKSDPTNLIDLMMTMSSQQLHVVWTGNTNQASLFVTLPGELILSIELDLGKTEGKKDILRTKLAEILGDQFAADIEPLLAQTFTFNWNGENKKFSIKFHKEQNLHIKSLGFKKAVGRFSSFKNLFMKIGEWLTKDRMITLPKEIHGDVDFANAKINFKKGTSFFIRTLLGSKRAGLRLISFGRENMIDIGIKCVGGHLIDIDTRTSDIDKDRTRFAIVDRG